MNRRSFLTTLSAAGATALLPGCARASRATRGTARPPLGVQLYTVRREMQRDVEGTLARVASLGYREVEFAGYFGRTASQIRSALAAAGLRAPATHLAIEALEGERQARTLAEAAEAGHEWIVVPWLAVAARRGLDDWRRTAARLNAIARAAQRAGLAFAYHNHDFELLPIAGPSGESRIPLELLVAETDPVLVKLELDVYWAVKGGADPLSYFARWPGRVTMLHLKDSAGAPQHRMVDVGTGTIDWRTIIDRGVAAGVRHAFVEHDDPGDAWASIGASAEFLKRMG